MNNSAGSSSGQSPMNKEELSEVLKETTELLISNVILAVTEKCVLPSLEDDDFPKVDSEPPLPKDSSSVTQPSMKHQLEPTVSNLEREILLRGDSAEKRAKILQLPSSSIPNTPSHYEREVVGDDRAQNKAHVICECEQPSVAGAAVPIVTSFTNSNTDGPRVIKREIAHKPKPSLIPKLTSTFKGEKNAKTATDPVKQGRNICFSDSSRKVKEEDPTDEEVQKIIRYRQLTKEFTEYVSRLSEETSNLTKETDSPESQVGVVDELYRHIINLRKVTAELKMLQNSKAVSESRILRVQQEAPVSTDLKSKNKDSNKIYIKFLPTKSTIKPKKSCNSEVQTTVEPSLEPKEVDSMDGVFIPSMDGPPEPEDEDEVDDDGLDITITFPELQKSVDQDNSHLSVCFSDLSAEALGRLKRCPKEFTLRMDFVQGKMYFQSAKSNANSYSIGPDMKITECSVDPKKSDIISIKPSTECLYTSQIIPVEGGSTKDSIKILKSTDSELFNVVSLPHINQRSYSATQSCITFRNIQKTAGESLLTERAYYKSMPQIPSLTRILEEPTNGYTPSAVRNEKRTRYRGLQRKRTTTSLEHIL